MQFLAKRLWQSVSLGLIVAVFLAAAQHVTGQNPQRQPAGSGHGHGMMGGAGHGQGMMGGMGRGQGMMGGMGQGQCMMGGMQGMQSSGAMQIRQRMCMSMHQHDPAALLAVKDELHLTPQQVEALDKLLNDTRQQAAALLNAEQQAQLGQLIGSPDASGAHAAHADHAGHAGHAKPEAKPNKPAGRPAKKSR
jgi:hypothetical protein